MQASSEARPPTARTTQDETLQDAFRELHGTRLHGFALLLTLGDQATAARLAAQALAAGAVRAGELSHPERAAAWLRRRVVRAAGRRGDAGRAPTERRRVALEELGVDDAALAGLGALGMRERAVLVASTIERLDSRDVATIVGVDGGRLERLVKRARKRAMGAAAARVELGAADDGPLAAHIRSIAARTMA
jgi:DNA-directed RNA polymerase specialized sigma24 family protein